MKKLLIALLVIVVLIGVGLLYIASNLDRIAAGAIESIGTKLLGVDVTVGSVELQLKEGRGSIRDFEIANPPGYSRSPVVGLGELTLEIDSEARSVRLLRAGAPEILVESIEGTSNVDVLLETLASQPSEPADGAESEVVDEAGEPVTLRIDRIEIEAARAVLESDEREEPLDLQVEALVFQNLEGTGEEIASQILRQLLTKVKEAAGQALRDSVNQAVEDKKEELRQDVEDAVEEKKEDLREGARERLRERASDGG
jgi:hypothetical protein